MNGLVLCGGLSSRMGTDKGLLLHLQQTWAQQAVELLQSFVEGVYVSINKEQKTVYSSYFSIEKLVEDNAIIPVKGPLLGILSLHAKQLKEDILVLACDMPVMHANIINQLIQAYVNKNGYDAYVFKNEQQAEPLCAIYTSKALEIIIRQTLEKTLHKYSMHFVLDQLNVYYIPVQQEQRKYFTNINSPDALSSL